MFGPIHFTLYCISWLQIIFLELTLFIVIAMRMTPNEITLMFEGHKKLDGYNLLLLNSDKTEFVVLGQKHLALSNNAANLGGLTLASIITVRNL